MHLKKRRDVIACLGVPKLQDIVEASCSTGVEDSAKLCHDQDGVEVADRVLVFSKAHPAMHPLETVGVV